MLPTGAVLIESSNSHHTPLILALPNEILSRIFAFATQPEVTTGSGYHRNDAEHNIQRLEDAHPESRQVSTTRIPELIVEQRHGPTRWRVEEVGSDVWEISLAYNQG